MKTDCFSNKNGKMYGTCKECFNKKLMCKYSNREFNKTFLSKHVEMPYKKLHSNNTEGASNITAKLASHKMINHNDENNNDENNRTKIVGPTFCGKTHLFLNKLQLIRLDNPEQRTKIISRSPEQYTNTALLAFGIEIEDTSLEEDVEDGTIQHFQNCCVVFDDMLDSTRKLIDPFFTRG